MKKLCILYLSFYQYETSNKISSLKNQHVGTTTRAKI